MNKRGRAASKFEKCQTEGQEKPSRERERQARFPSVQVRGKIITGHHWPGHIPPKYYRAGSQTWSEGCLREDNVRCNDGRGNRNYSKL